MQRKSWLLFLILVAGCSRGGPAQTAPEMRPGPNVSGPDELYGIRHGDTGNPGAGVVLGGLTAPQWGEQLQVSRDHAVRSEASMALAEMGEVGYPHLAAGMQSNSDEVRIAALQAIGKPALLAHRDEMVPLLTRMLRDREPMIRRSAAARLCWFGAGAKSALPDLQAMAANDPLPDIRQVARVSVEVIQSPNAEPPRGVEPAKTPGK